MVVREFEKLAVPRAIGIVKAGKISICTPPSTSSG